MENNYIKQDSILASKEILNFHHSHILSSIGTTVFPPPVILQNCVKEKFFRIKRRCKNRVNCGKINLGRDIIALWRRKVETLSTTCNSSIHLDQRKEEHKMDKSDSSVFIFDFVSFWWKHNVELMTHNPPPAILQYCER